jgi:hypothetical protein
MLDEARMALNKLTLEKFDKLSVHLLELGIKDIEQVREWASDPSVGVALWLPCILQKSLC